MTVKIIQCILKVYFNGDNRMYTISQLRTQTKKIFNQALTTPIQLSRGKQIFYLLGERQYKQLQVDFIRNMIQSPPQDIKAQPVAPVGVEIQTTDKFYDVFHRPSGERILKRVNYVEAENYLAKYDIDGDLDIVEMK